MEKLVIHFYSPARDNDTTLLWYCQFHTHTVLIWWIECIIDLFSLMSSIQWARDEFEGLFKQPPENAMQYLTWVAFPVTPKLPFGIPVVTYTYDMLGQLFTFVASSRDLWSLFLQRSKVHGAYSETSWSSACRSAGGCLQESCHRLPPQLGWLCSMGTQPLAVPVQQQHPSATPQLSPRTGTYWTPCMMNISRLRMLAVWSILIWTQNMLLLFDSATVKTAHIQWTYNSFCIHHIILKSPAHIMEQFVYNSVKYYNTMV